MLKIFLMVLLPWHSLLSISHAVEPTIPDEISKTLEANAQGLSGIDLVWHQRRKLLKEPAAALKELETLQSEEDFTLKRECIVRIDGIKLFESFRDEEGIFGGFGKDSDERSFNGEKYFSGTVHPSDKANPGVLIIDWPRRSVVAERHRIGKRFLFEFWYLFEVGFRPPNRSNSMGSEVKPLVLDLIERGRLISCSQLDNQNLYEVVIEYPDPWATSKDYDFEKHPPVQRYKPKSQKFQINVAKMAAQLDGKLRTCRLLLDPEFNYAVREKWISRGRKLMFHTTCDDFFEVGKRLWLPKSCRVVSHAYDTRPTYVADAPVYETLLQLQRAEYKSFSKEDFEIWFDTPGIFVADYTLPDATEKTPINYHVPSSREDLDRVIRQASPRYLQKENPRTKWLIAANMVLVGVFIVFLIVKKVRKARKIR